MGAAAAAATGLLLLASAAAQTPARPLTLAALPTGTRAPTCTVVAERARFDAPLARMGRKLAASEPVRIVALGSSSTAGAGASSPARSYPSRLKQELARLLPGHKVTVINRGVNGEEIAEMLARLDRDVLAEKADLILWQVGTNALLAEHPVTAQAALLHEGLVRLKASGSDVVLIDPQLVPSVIEKADAERMVAAIARVAKEDSVCLFRRFALMRHWHESERIPFATFVSDDGLHMNDWSYGCLAKWLGTAIAEAATRPMATAGGAGVVR
jgi:acyl-CoA thioesterase-1